MKIKFGERWFDENKWLNRVTLHNFLNDDNRDLHQELSDSDDWKSNRTVDMVLTINGHEINTETFFDRIDKFVDLASKQEAKEIPFNFSFFLK